MKKALSEFIEAKDIPSVFVPSWRKEDRTDEILNIFEEMVQKIEKVDFGENNNFFQEKALSFGIPEDMLFMLYAYLRFFLRDYNAGEDVTIFYPVIDSSEIYRGEMFVCCDRGERLLEGCLIDSLIEDSWKTPFKLEHKQMPIYPASGFVFYKSNPLSNELISLFDVKAEVPLYWTELSRIYHHYFPECDSDNTNEYYLNLRSIGLYPRIPVINFFIGRMIGIIREDVNFEMFHKVVNTSYIEF